ncbi:unnamed protein product [Rotaria magnacalcarata]|uniref:Uncharacterized protein n=2 Tax=Rotaria magnacalcarata TaxID=392030 RepID=A0A816ZXK4_9BILA|nr:unnamed protein product [Rotaria magnacalcarata]CAF2233736.1 unnamed protein product [Rotaria magnacalcarata]CAF4199683.1 unnamed protein product [Rotaria magnacalcarata]CAF4214893.1 unnamed protein product [Rotaria magnacalcarata]
MKHQQSLLSDKQSNFVEPGIKRPTAKKEVSFQLPTAASIGNTMETSTTAQEFDETKQEENLKSGNLVTMNTKQTAIQPETTVSTSKKEGRFHLPSMPSIDNTLQTIRGTLGLDEVKRDQNAESENSSATEEKAETMETMGPFNKLLTTKKESGFYLPIMPLFDKTLQTIRGTLWLDNMNQEESVKAENLDSDGVTLTPTQSEGSNSTPKKEGRVRFPTFPFSDTTMESIKELPRHARINRQRSSKSESPDTSSTVAVQIESPTLPSIEKKESRFHLPTIQSFDNTMNSIRETFGFDATKQDENIKNSQFDFSGAKDINIQSTAETPTTKKEGAFHLPTVPLFENAIMSIKGIFNYVETKPETDEKRDQSSAVGVGQVPMESDKTNLA